MPEALWKHIDMYPTPAYKMTKKQNFFFQLIAISIFKS